MTFRLTPAQLALLGSVAGAMVSAAVEAIRHGTGSVDWGNVAISAVLAGVGAYSQSHKTAPEPSPNG